MQRLRDLKEQGNAQYKRGDWAAAAAHYSAALEAAASPGGRPPGLLAVTCLSNRAQCLLQLGRHEEALADCQAAQAGWAGAPEQRGGAHAPPAALRTKVLYRRALAERALGRVEGARETLTLARAEGLLTPEGVRLAEELQALTM